MTRGRLGSPATPTPARPRPRSCSIWHQMPCDRTDRSGTPETEQVVRSGGGGGERERDPGRRSEATAARGAAVFETLVDDLLAVHDLAFGAP
ncbi:MAG: hypothetical protein R2705_04480 [Ilumatobacteraceae bacterium]